MTFLPPPDLEYLSSKGIPFEEIEDGGNKGIILKDHALPDNKFDANEADILVVLPSGYADVAPDMFHLLPWVRLKSTNAYPRKADRSRTFAGKEWQRWSRHCKDWRPGKDGIWTMLKRIEHALIEAA